MLRAALLPLAEWPVKSLWHQPGCDCVFLPLGSGMRPPELINHRHQEGHLMDMNFNCFPPGRDGNWRPRGEMPRLLLTTVQISPNLPKNPRFSTNPSWRIYVICREFAAMVSSNLGFWGILVMFWIFATLHSANVLNKNDFPPPPLPPCLHVLFIKASVYGVLGRLTDKASLLRPVCLWSPGLTLTD